MTINIALDKIENFLFMLDDDEEVRVKFKIHPDQEKEERCYYEVTIDHGTELHDRIVQDAELLDGLIF